MLAATISTMSQKGFCCSLKARSLLYTRFQIRATETTANTIRVPACAEKATKTAVELLELWPTALPCADASPCLLQGASCATGLSGWAVAKPIVQRYCTLAMKMCAIKPKTTLLTSRHHVNKRREVCQDRQRQGGNHHKQGGVDRCACLAIHLPKHREEQVGARQGAAEKYQTQQSVVRIIRQAA